jgi:hypothetical protein
MKSFELSLNGNTYSVTPDSNIKGVYRIMVDDRLHKVIQEDEDENWQELDQKTLIPISVAYDEYVNKLGNQIESYLKRLHE